MPERTLYVEIPGMPEWLNVKPTPVRVADDEFSQVPDRSAIIPHPYIFAVGATVGTTPLGDDFYINPEGELIYSHELGG